MVESDLSDLLGDTPIISFKKTEVVTLLVGLDNDQLVVHENVITRYSRFFQSAVTKGWVEGQTRTIKLPEESSQIMPLYINFCYTKAMPTAVFISASLGEERCDQKVEQCWLILAKLYVLGERLLDKEDQHAVMREFLRITSLEDADGESNFPTGDSIGVIYGGTTAASPGRRLMVDLHVAYGLACWIADDICQEFLRDLSRALLDSVSGEGRVARHQELNAESYFNE